MLTINGQPATATGVLLQDYLATAGYKAEHIAVELNGQIVPRTAYSQTILKDGDQLEIVRFVGGG